MNKYRLSIMIILIIMLFLYMINILNISDETNFAFTFSALIFSVSSATDTFYNENKCEKIIRFILDTMAIGVAILLPNLSNTELIAKIMRVIDSNVLLLLALFFTMAGQWAIEIKLKDIGNNKRKGEKYESNKAK